MNIPQARAKAAHASFPTFVDVGNDRFNIRRTHATGGSNSTADGSFCDCCGWFPESVRSVADIVTGAESSGEDEVVPDTRAIFRKMM
jgi:hypothetical protein